MSAHDSSLIQWHRDATIVAARGRSGGCFHRLVRRAVANGFILLMGCLLVSQPVVAQSSAKAFCQTALAQTIMNMFGVIQLGGPLLGGLVALGATVSLPMVRRSDLKREIKQVRNQGILWGVIVAPLGTSIVQFLLANVVAGGPACSF